MVSLENSAIALHGKRKWAKKEERTPLQSGVAELNSRSASILPLIQIPLPIVQHHHQVDVIVPMEKCFNYNMIFELLNLPLIQNAEYREIQQIPAATTTSIIMQGKGNLFSSKTKE